MKPYVQSPVAPNKKNELSILFVECIFQKEKAPRRHRGQGEKSCLTGDEEEVPSLKQILVKSLRKNTFIFIRSSEGHRKRSQENWLCEV